jgi:hypothetical protein
MLNFCIVVTSLCIQTYQHLQLTSNKCTMETCSTYLDLMNLIWCGCILLLNIYTWSKVEDGVWLDKTKTIYSFCLYIVLAFLKQCIYKSQNDLQFEMNGVTFWNIGSTLHNQLLAWPVGIAVCVGVHDICNRKIDERVNYRWVDAHY